MTRLYKSPPATEIDYGRVIKDSFRAAWRHKFLWFFGFFSGTTTAFGGWSCDYNSYVIEPGADETSSAREIAYTLIDWVQEHIVIIATLLAIGFIGAVIFWLWSILCHGAVVASVRDIEEDRPLSFGSVFEHGKRNFRRLFPYMLLFSLAPLLFIILVTGAVLLLYLLFTSMGDGGIVVGAVLLSAAGLLFSGALLATLGYLAFVGLLPILAIMVFLAFNLGSRSIVLGGLRTIAAIKEGVRLLFENLLKGGFLYIISMGISIGSTIIIVFAMLFAAIPAIAVWIITINADMPLAGLLVSILLTLPLVVILILFAAAINTYFTIYWTDAWMLFKGEKVHRKPSARSIKNR